MGASGAGSFDNDDAMDWVSELAGASDWSHVEAAFESVNDLAPDDYLQAPEASVALAAAEVVAAAIDAPGADLPDEVKDWVKDHGEEVAPRHAKEARKAVDRVAEKSELLDLWTESDDATSWQAAIVDLQKRLAGAHSTIDLLGEQ